MINHQSPYGQIIKIPSDAYYSMTDDQIKLAEEKYANSTKPIINFHNTNELADEYLDEDAPSIQFNFTDGGGGGGDE